MSPITANELVLSPQTLQVLAAMPARTWRSEESLIEELGVTSELLHELACKGLLVSDCDEPTLIAMRRFDKRLATNAWNAYGLLYYSMFHNRWGERSATLEDGPSLADIAAGSAESFETLVSQCGAPPPPFHHPAKAGKTFKLPRVEKTGQLYETLLQRRTTRAFDHSRPMAGDDLATLLHFVWGCHGVAQLSEHVQVLKKTSPSGGSLHPVEVYPLLIDVAGFEPGIYHYSTHDHSLALLRPLPRKEAEAAASRAMGGQAYARGAHALFLMTARFKRSFWKYRRLITTLSVVLMDAAHLSQTFYLVSTQLGLGAFYSAAINAPFIEEHLGIDGFDEGAIAINGCGLPLTDEPEPSLDFAPFYDDGDGLGA